MIRTKLVLPCPTNKVDIVYTLGETGMHGKHGRIIFSLIRIYC